MLEVAKKSSSLLAIVDPTFFVDMNPFSEEINPTSDLTESGLLKRVKLGVSLRNMDTASG